MAGHWKPILAIVVITLMVYWPTLGHDFLHAWDDDVYVMQNPLVNSKSPIDVKRILLTSVNGVYSPLTVLSFSVEHKLFGQVPFYFHLDNVLLHILVCILLFQLAMMLGLSVTGAFLGATLFAVHPMHVESVAWISERKDVLYSTFYLLALLQYIVYTRTANRWHFILSVIFGFLSMLAKPMALSLPLVLLLLDHFLERRRSWIERINEKIWYWLFIVPLAFCSLWSVGQSQGALMQAILLWIFSFVFYIKKFFVPDVFLPHYELPQPVIVAHPVYMGAVLVFAVLLYVIIRFKAARWFMFAWGFFFLSIFFLLRIGNVMSIQNVANLSQVADRFMYLPSAGFCLWAGFLAQEALNGKTRKIGAFMIVGILVFLSARTFVQVQVWKDDTVLWTHAINHAPQDPLGYINRASSFMFKGDQDKAIADYTRAMQIDSGAYVSDLASKFPHLNKEQLAEANVTNTLLLNNPYYVVALRGRARVYFMAKDIAAARADCDATLRIGPEDNDMKALARLVAGR